MKKYFFLKIKKITLFFLIGLVVLIQVPITKAAVPVVVFGDYLDNIGYGTSHGPSEITRADGFGISDVDTVWWLGAGNYKIPQPYDGYGVQDVDVIWDIDDYEDPWRGDLEVFNWGFATPELERAYRVYGEHEARSALDPTTGNISGYWADTISDEGYIRADQGGNNVTITPTQKIMEKGEDISGILYEMIKNLNVRICQELNYGGVIDDNANINALRSSINIINTGGEPFDVDLSDPGDELVGCVKIFQEQVPGFCGSLQGTDSFIPTDKLPPHESGFIRFELEPFPPIGTLEEIGDCTTKCQKECNNLQGISRTECENNKENCVTKCEANIKALDDRRKEICKQAEKITSSIALDVHIVRDSSDIIEDLKNIAREELGRKQLGEVGDIVISQYEIAGHIQNYDDYLAVEPFNAGVTYLDAVHFNLPEDDDQLTLPRSDIDAIQESVKNAIEESYRVNSQEIIRPVRKSGYTADLKTIFSSGTNNSWTNWLAALDDRNNPYGVFFSAVEASSELIAQEKLQRSTQAVANQGLNPLTSSSDETGPDGMPKSVIDKPGSVIAGEQVAVTAALLEKAANPAYAPAKAAQYSSDVKAPLPPPQADLITGQGSEKINKQWEDISKKSLGNMEDIFCLCFPDFCNLKKSEAPAWSTKDLFGSISSFGYGSKTPTIPGLDACDSYLDVCDFVPEICTDFDIKTYVPNSDSSDNNYEPWLGLEGDIDADKDKERPETIGSGHRSAEDMCIEYVKKTMMGFLSEINGPSLDPFPQFPLISGVIGGAVSSALETVWNNFLEALASSICTPIGNAVENAESWLEDFRNSIEWPPADWPPADWPPENWGDVLGDWELGGNLGDWELGDLWSGFIDNVLDEIDWDFVWAWPEWDDFGFFE